MKNPFLYDLAKSTPAVKKPSGTVQLAYEKVFPVVAGQNAAMALVVLKKGGIREPHWHPDAWEFDYCISGEARMSVVGPNDEWHEVSRSSPARSYSSRRAIFTISRISAKKISAS